MANSNTSAQHHHHHHSGKTDETSIFREHMLGRRKRNKTIANVIWLAGIAVALILAMCVVYAYVLDK